MGGLPRARYRWLPRALGPALGLAALAGDCHHATPNASGDGGPTVATDGGEDPTAASAVAPGDSAAPAASAAPSPGGPPSDKPLLGVTAFAATVYKEPRDSSKKLGYLRVGYKISRDLKLALDVFNLFDRKASDIDYYYASRLKGEPAEGVNDLHFHPVEARTVRLTLTANF